MRPRERIEEHLDHITGHCVCGPLVMRVGGCTGRLHWTHVGICLQSSGAQQNDGRAVAPSADKRLIVLL